MSEIVPSDPCPYCGSNSWRQEPILVRVNPNGEYVVGYGHRPAFSNTGKFDRFCTGCGWKQGGNPVVVDMNGKVLRTVKV